MAIRAAARRLDRLGVPSVRLLWLAGIGAGIMRWLEVLAYSVLVLELDGTAFDVALVNFARFMPLMILGAPAGALAERFDPRRLLVAAFTLMAALQAAAALVSVSGLLQFWHILGLAFLNGVFWVVEIPVRRTYLAEAGGEGQVAVTMGLEMVTTHLTRLTGPPIGGALIASAGLTGVCLLGTLLYATSACLIARVHRSGRAAPPTRIRLSRALLEGAAFVRHEPRLLALVILTVIFNLFGLPYLALIPVVADGAMGLGPFGTGLLMSAEAIGAILATLPILATARPAWFGPIFGLGCLLFFASELVLGWAASVPVAFLLLTVAGMGMGGFSVMQATIPVSQVPSGMRVRVAGVVMAAIGAAPIGFLLAGFLGDRLGGGPAIATLGAMGLASTLLALWRWPAMALPTPQAPRASWPASPTAARGPES